MVKLSKKDYMCCLTCVAFAVLLNLVVPHVAKLVNVSGSDPLSQAVRRIQDSADQPIASSLVIAFYVFGACCLGFAFPLLK